MLLPRSIALALAAGLVTAVVGAPATAAPHPRPAPGPGHPVLSGTTNAAERALDAVQAAFQRSEVRGHRPSGMGVRDGELTQQLVQLRLGLDDLSGQDRRLAEAFLARPTDGSEWYGAHYGARADATRTCGRNVCIHYARATKDAPPPADSDGDGLPDQVEKTRDTINQVWASIVTGGEYQAPLPDGKEGGDSRLDVYLVDLGWDGLYGYCSPESARVGRAAPAYCVLDDDYAEEQYGYQTSPTGNLEVTAAHEFFHAVQFGYDAAEDAWLVESTATWIEDEVYNDVNDNLGFLPASALRVPGRSLDSPVGSFMYGNWIWWRYLSERYPDTGSTGLPILVRRVWELAGGRGGTYSMAALDAALTEQKLDLADVFADFSVANRMPEKHYVEGEAYRRAPLSGRYWLNLDRRAIREQQRNLAHLSSTTVTFLPGSDLSADGWMLDVRVDLPRRRQQPSAVVTVVGRDGSVDRGTIRLNRRGDGARAMRFDSTTVERVELTLVNGNHAYKCNAGTRWSCRGTPSPTRPFTFRASTHRTVS